MIDHPSKQLPLIEAAQFLGIGRTKGAQPAQPPHPKSGVMDNEIFLQKTHPTAVARRLLDLLNNPKGCALTDHAMRRLRNDVLRALIAKYVRRMVFADPSGKLKRYEPICQKAQVWAELNLLIDRNMGGQTPRRKGKRNTRPTKAFCMGATRRGDRLSP